MKFITTKQILTTALTTVFITSSAIASDCNDANGINGWGTSCGIDTFLDQQAPTAAGPQKLNNRQNYVPSQFDSENFGGQINNADFNWKGYAYINVNRIGSQSEQRQPTVALNQRSFNDYSLGEMQMNLNKDTNLIDIILTFKDRNGVDQTLSFKKDPTFLGATGQFQVKTEDGQYQINAIPTLALKPQKGLKMAGSLSTENSTQNEYLTSGGIRDNTDNQRIGYFVGGSLTPVTAIQALASTNKIASYSISGDFKRGNRNMRFSPNANMTVNFGTSSFSSNWHGLEGHPMSTTTISGTVNGNSFQSNHMTHTNHYFMPPVAVTDTINNNNVQANHVTHFIAPVPTTVTGNMKGSFNGDQAQALSGSLNVNLNGSTTEGVFIGQQIKNIVNEVQ